VCTTGVHYAGDYPVPGTGSIRLFLVESIAAVWHVQVAWPEGFGGLAS